MRRLNQQKLRAPLARRSRLLLALPLATILAAAACTGTSGGSSPDSGSNSGGTSSGKTSMVVAVPAAVNQFIVDAGGGAYVPTAIEIGLQLNERLIRNPYVKSTQDPNALVQQFDTFEGALAESYSVSADGKTYTFKLRQGVRSQAGNLFTADDVMWSFKEKYDTPTAPWANLTGEHVPFSGIKKINDYAVSITLDSASFGATFLSLLSNIGGEIYDSTLLKQHVRADDPYGMAWANSNPTIGISYGPYTVSGINAGTQITLKANPNYYGTKPAIQQVIYQVVASSATRALSLRSGAIDVAENLAPSDQADLQKSGAAKVFDVPTVQFAYFVPVSNRAPFDQARVRQAMAYAIPYDKILQNVYLGRATQPKGLLNPSATGYTDTDLPVYKYDPAKSKELLAAAGHPDGVSFTLTVSSDIPDTVAAAVQLQSAAKDAGFSIKIQQLPATAFSKGQQDGTFEAMLLRDSAFTQTPSYELDLYLDPKQASYYTKWADPNYNKLRNAAFALGNPFTETAGTAWAKAEGYVLDQAAIVPYATVKPSIAVGKNVQGWAWQTDDFTDLSQLSFG